MSLCRQIMTTFYGYDTSMESEAVSSTVIDNSAVNNLIYEKLQETIVMEYIQQNAHCLYRFNCGDESEVIYKPDDSNEWKIDANFDQTINRIKASNVQSNRQPSCTFAERHNHRYYMKFDGNNRYLYCDLNINKKSDKLDIVNAFIVYRLTGFDSSTEVINNCLFGNGDKFVAFLKTPYKNLLFSTGNNKNLHTISNSQGTKNRIT